MNSLSPQATAASIESIKEMEIVQTKSLSEIKAWRDEKLISILKLIQED